MRFELPTIRMAWSGRQFAASAITAVLCMLGVMCGGCQSAHVTESVTAKYKGNDTDAQLNFWHELADRRLTSNDDAFHGILLDMNGHDNSADYAGRVAELKQRGLLPESFSKPADVAIERGTLAFVIVKILNIHGGWVMHVFGDTPRYAVRELVYDDIFPPSSPQQTFSGAEFVGVIGKVDDYQKPLTTNASAP